MKHVVVVGAGFGGLAAAIHLRRRGARVTVLEKNDHLGGKVDQWSSGGYRFDTGPTLLTMPDVVRDVFSAAGVRLDDHLELVRLDPLCRYRFADGSMLDASDDPAVMESRVAAFSPADAGSYRRFLDHAEESTEPRQSRSCSRRSRRSAGKRCCPPCAISRHSLRIDALRTLRRVGA